MGKISFAKEIEELRVELSINKSSLNHFLKKIPVDTTMEDVVTAIKNRYGDDGTSGTEAESKSDDKDAKEPMFSEKLKINSDIHPHEVQKCPVTGRPV